MNGSISLTNEEISLIANLCNFTIAHNHRLNQYEVSAIDKLASRLYKDNQKKVRNVVVRSKKIRKEQRVRDT